MLEGGVIGVHLHLGQNGGDALDDAPVQKLFPQGILQVIADVALAHGHADGQGAGNVFFGVRAGQFGHGRLDHTHLGAVAVGHHHLVTFFNQVRDGTGSLLHGHHLLGKILAQGIAAQGDHDALTHDENTSQKRQKHKRARE